MNRFRGFASTALLFGAFALVAPAFSEDNADFQGNNNPFVTELAAPAVAASAEPIIIPLKPDEKP